MGHSSVDDSCRHSFVPLPFHHQKLHLLPKTNCRSHHYCCDPKLHLMEFPRNGSGSGCQRHSEVFTYMDVNMFFQYYFICRSLTTCDLANRRFFMPSKAARFLAIASFNLLDGEAGDLPSIAPESDLHSHNECSFSQNDLLAETRQSQEKPLQFCSRANTTHYLYLLTVANYFILLN